MAKTKIKARVKATVEIDVGVWRASTCGLDDLFDQVRKEGIRKLESMIDGVGSIVGEQPSVVFIVVEEER